jgi:hypothetical protein
MSHEHVWVEKSRAIESDKDGIYLLRLWDDANYIHRKVPSVYSECECGDSRISPLKEELRER